MKFVDDDDDDDLLINNDRVSNIKLSQNVRQLDILMITA